MSKSYRKIKVSLGSIDIYDEEVKCQSGNNELLKEVLVNKILKMSKEELLKILQINIGSDRVDTTENFIPVSGENGVSCWSKNDKEFIF